MAEGYINLDVPETKPVTLATGFEKVSWGYVQAIKLGHLILVNGSGIYSTTAVSSLIEFATISGVTLTFTTTGFVKLPDGTTTSVQLHAGSTDKLRISAGIPANTNFDFSVVGFCN